jgi:hypothetical protein
LGRMLAWPAHTRKASPGIYGIGTPTGMYHGK